VNLRSSLPARDNPLAITATVLHFTTQVPPATNFQPGAAFLPHSAKPKTSSEPAQNFLFNRRETRANACFVESNHLETNADVATATSSDSRTTRIQNITNNV